MQQTLKLHTFRGYAKNAAPWDFIPEGDRLKFSSENEEDTVRFLNEAGWVTINVFPVSGGYYDKEIWLTREVDESAVPAG